MFQPLLKPQQLRQVTGSCRLIFPVCIRVNLEPTVEEKNAGITPVMMTTYVQWPFQDPKLKVPTIYKAYVRAM